MRGRLTGIHRLDRQEPHARGGSVSGAGLLLGTVRRAERRGGAQGLERGVSRRPGKPVQVEVWRVDLVLQTNPISIQACCVC